MEKRKITLISFLIAISVILSNSFSFSIPIKTSNIVIGSDVVDPDVVGPGRYIDPCPIVTVYDDSFMHDFCLRPKPIPPSDDAVSVGKASPGAGVTSGGVVVTSDETGGTSVTIT
ncbi:912_t:CDS:2 [Ambispora gerdemannii]|uniref:912_t:CDS:1 n=1 Tax=Ambispora gerdemannii TaxID=144530 RepID=A0A9N9D1S3_9GLOM|nr:912_t:CDS:2 [Ambispora gerdemannii]